MRTLRPAPVIALGLAAICLAELAGMAVASNAPEGEPVLVVAPPWRGGPEAVVLAAGGTVIGPTQAPLSVLATDVSSRELRDAGAWFLLDPSKLAFLCASGTTK